MGSSDYSYLVPLDADEIDFRRNESRSISSTISDDDISELITKPFGMAGKAKTPIEANQCDDKKYYETIVRKGINEEEETMPYVLPICEEGQLKTFELTNESFRKPVEVAKHALVKVKEIARRLFTKFEKLWMRSMDQT